MATKSLRGRRAHWAVGLTVTALALAGCSGGAPANSASVPTAAEQVTGELNVLVSSASGSDAGFKAVNAAFAQKYPQVKVNFAAVPNENYNQARSSRLSAGTIDVGLAGPKELPSYVPESNKGDDARLADAGGFVDLTDQPFMKKFSASVLDKIKYAGKNYTVPTGLSVLQRPHVQQEDLQRQQPQGADHLGRVPHSVPDPQGQEHYADLDRRQGHRGHRDAQRGAEPVPDGAEQAGSGQGALRGHRGTEHGQATRGAAEGAATLRIRAGQLRRLEPTTR